jgi:hypothetical protein
LEPDLERLAALLDETKLAVVVEGSHFDARRRKVPRVLARTSDPVAIAELRSALRCVPGARRMDWMMPGGPTVALFAIGRRPLATVSAVGRDYVRSPGSVTGDVLLAEPERLVRWLALVSDPTHFGHD